MNSSYYDTKLIKKECLASDVYAFYFERPENFSFIAGQYMRLYLNVPNPDERGSNRPISIASAPSEPHLRIATRIGISSFKKTLSALKEETPVKIFGPLGGFILKPDVKTHVFLAGGIGITAIRSIILDAFEKHSDIQVYLFTSFKTPEEIVFQNDFFNLKEKSFLFNFIQTISRPEESKAPWSGETGRVNAKMIRKYVSQFKEAYYYISGPVTMVDGLFGEVTSLGVDKNQIIKEKFTGY